MESYKGNVFLQAKDVGGLSIEVLDVTSQLLPWLLDDGEEVVGDFNPPPATHEVSTQRGSTSQIKKLNHSLASKTRSEMDHTGWWEKFDTIWH